jgi:hypothetical protein
VVSAMLTPAVATIATILGKLKRQIVGRMGSDVSAFRVVMATYLRGVASWVRRKAG